MAQEVMRLMESSATASVTAASVQQRPKGRGKAKAGKVQQRQPRGNATAPVPANQPAPAAELKTAGQSVAAVGDDAGSEELAAAETTVPRALQLDVVAYETEAVQLWDQRTHGGHVPVPDGPVVNVVRGLGKWLPFLQGEQATPIVCVADWQFHPATQRHFWGQVVPLLEDACGGPEVLARSLLIIAGDMASLTDDLRGVASDSVPELEPFTECLGPKGAMFFVYGNHDDEVPVVRSNANGLSQLLPDGEVLDTGRSLAAGLAGRNVAAAPRQRRWGRLQDEAAGVATDTAPQGGGKQLRWGRQPAGAADGERSESRHQKREHTRGLALGGVHGIPSGKPPIRSPWKKRERSLFFRQVRKVCAGADIAVLHQNASLPHLDTGPDACQVLDIFSQGSAPLLVHGHYHMERVVSIVEGRKVIVNADNRAVLLLPDDASQSDSQQ